MAESEKELIANDIIVLGNIEAKGKTFNSVAVYNPSDTFSVVAATGITPINNSILPIQGSGGAVIVTANPQIASGSDGQILLLRGESDSNTVTISDGNGIHLHSDSIVTLTNHDWIMLAYDTGDSQWEEITSNFPSSEKAWSFFSPSGASGTKYYGGFYEFASSDNDFSGGPTFGTANASKAAHFFTVLGATTVDELTIRITGTSISDTAARATSDTEDIVYAVSSSANTYKETSKKWIGTVTITVQSGTAKTCNYGFSKYWDNHNSDFRVTGLEATWLGGANDGSADILLRHHKATGWTFNSGSTPTPPTAIASMATDHVTEINIVSDEAGAWKRTNLNTRIIGNNGEGTIIEIVTSANKAFEIGNFLLRTRSN